MTKQQTDIKKAISELQLTLKEINTNNTDKILINAEYIDTKLERIKSILLQEEETTIETSISKWDNKTKIRYCGKCKIMLSGNAMVDMRCDNCGTKLIWNKNQ